MKKMAAPFLHLIHLLNDGEYHDGTNIGQQLSITRSAVWKMMKKLKSYGIAVESKKGLGYALKKPFIPLRSAYLKKQLAEKNLVLDIFETLDSTNDYLKKFCQGKKTRVCLTEQQSQGKGRFNRSWHSPFGQNIYLSLLYCFDKDISELAGLGLCMGLAITHTLSAFNKNENFAIKWPNDILHQNKKLAGVLIEVVAETHDSCYAIIGVGLNVNMAHGKNNISQPWTALNCIQQDYIDRNPLCVALIENLLAYLQRFSEHGLKDFINEWKKVDILYKKPVSLKTGQNLVAGEAQGISPRGHLLLELADGRIQEFSSGEASVLKEDGVTD